MLLNENNIRYSLSLIFGETDTVIHFLKIKMGKRKSLTFEAKIKIIKELEKGVSQRDLSLKKGVSKSVIFVIKKKQRKFCKIM
jgi:hypothetical protein